MCKNFVSSALCKKKALEIFVFHFFFTFVMLKSI